MTDREPPFSYWTDPRLPGVRFVAARGTPQRGPVLTEFSTLGTLTEGSGTLHTPFGTARFAPGELVWIPAGVLHRIVTRPDGRPPARALYLAPELLSRWVGAARNEAAGRCAAVVSDVGLASRLLEHFVAAAPSDPGAPQRLRALVDEILGRVPDAAVARIGWRATDPTDDGAVGTASATASRARELLERDLEQPLSIDALAARCGVTRGHLHREFRKAYWLTPHQWRLVKQLQRAKQLIEAGTSLSESAVRSGFADQSHMHRWFRRFYMASPGLFAKVEAAASEGGVGCRASADTPTGTRHSRIIRQ